MAAPWAIVANLAGSTSKPSDSRFRAASVMTTMHLRQGSNLVQNGPLMRRRMGEDRVGDHDGRDVETAQDFEHFVPISAPVQPVLVLHHRHVELVQRFRRRREGAPRSVHKFADNGIALGVLSGGIDDPYDAYPGVMCRHSGRQSSGERGQTARRRRVRAEHPERARGIGGTFKRQVGDAHEMLLKEARSRRRTCTGRRRPTRPSCPSEATLPRGRERPAYREGTLLHTRRPRVSGGVAARRRQGGSWAT